MSSDARATCAVCPHACSPAEGRTGRCRARVARGAEVAPAGYGELTALALDPIEKKPIARWRPGTTVLSAGGFGCNMSCPWCQNHEIAQAGPGDAPTMRRSPDELAAAALAQAPQGCIGLAFTYNEPLVGWEFVRDAAQAAHQAGLANVLVSNGMACADVIEQLSGLIDAANIDLKAANEAAYARIGGDAACVRRTIAMLHAAGCHVEVTTLLVPGFNDDDAHIGRMAAWLASVDPGIPYHLTRFFPRHRMADAAPTPLATMRRARQIAREHLRDVLLGNM